jgi:tetratricopeptide (TPR) repeat protein
VWGLAPSHAKIVDPEPSESNELQIDVDAVAREFHEVPVEAVAAEGYRLVRPFVNQPGFPLEPSRLVRGIALLEHARRSAPDDVRLVWMLARAYRRAVSPRRAFDLFARALALAPDEYGIIVDYAQACLEHGRTAETVRLARRQVEMTGGIADAHSNLGVALFLHGDLDGADAALDASEAAASPDRDLIALLRKAIADVRNKVRFRPLRLVDLEGWARTQSEPPAVELTPDDARDAFAQAFLAYRRLLEADPSRVVPQEEREAIESKIGRIRSVEIVALDVDLSWVGSSLSPWLTERTTLVGSRDRVSRDARMRMHIEPGPDGWRVVESWVMP